MSLALYLISGFLMYNGYDLFCKKPSIRSKLLHSALMCYIPILTLSTVMGIKSDTCINLHSVIHEISLSIIALSILLLISYFCHYREYYIYEMKYEELDPIIIKIANELEKEPDFINHYDLYNDIHIYCDSDPIKMDIANIHDKKLCKEIIARLKKELPDVEIDPSSRHNGILSILSGLILLVVGIFIF